MVLDLLRKAHPDAAFEVVPYTTTGDAIRDVPLTEMGGAGVFTTVLERALQAGAIDFAVHSLKDLPTAPQPDLSVAALPARADVRDVLVARDGHDLAALPRAARVGTGSRRRAAQLLALRPDLDIAPIRGNVDTRIRQVLQDKRFDATVLAAAGLTRIGLERHATEWFTPDVLLPAPGQAALAVQCRTDDNRTRGLLAAIDDPGVRAATTAERTFLHTLGGGCAAPVAAYGTVAVDGRVHLSGLVVSVDGTRHIRVEDIDGDPETLGRTLAETALSRGARDLMPHA